MKDKETQGGVIWITGYSASGKTTVGRKVEQRLRTQNIRTIFLDGDDLRAILAHQWGYERKDRIELAKVYFRLCSHLSTQGFTVVISAVAMYDEIRKWLRDNVSNSIEVYLSVPEDIRRKRDAETKNIYQNYTHIEDIYDKPNNPALTINNYLETDPNSSAEQIVSYFFETEQHNSSDKGRHEHWNSYYSSVQAPVEASSFALYVESQIDQSENILEVGCGNGRDSVYFKRSGRTVSAIDVSETAIQSCNKNYAADKINFFCGTLDAVEKQLTGSYDVLYSRFCLHAMTFNEEDEFLTAAARVLSTSGRLFIECRSINDPLARKGDILSSTERIHGHYRRFIILDELKEKLLSHGFSIHLAEELRDVASLGDDNPVVIRVVAIKP